jgi:threonine/homoserine/homoserine lactone efflux protein
LRQGLVSNLANPKMLAFFTSLLPQFARSPVELLLFGLLFACLTLVWLTGYTLVAAKAEVVLRGFRVRRAVEVTTGAVLIGLGTQVALVRP